MVDVQKMIEFLHLRPGKDGRPVSSSLRLPEFKGNGWYRLPLLQGHGQLPVTSVAGGSSEWKIAWHGCPLEALYAIMFHGQLRESCDEGRGDRYFDGAPGVYMHGDHLAHKAENYSHFTSVFGDGTLWCVKLELMVDRTDRVHPRGKTDQWIQRSRSTRLVAVWVRGVSFSELEFGSGIRHWNPELEANPRDAEEGVARAKARAKAATIRGSSKRPSLHASQRLMTGPAIVQSTTATVPEVAEEEAQLKAKKKAARLAELKEARIKAEEAAKKKAAEADKMASRDSDSDDQSWGPDDWKGAGASGAAHNVSSHVRTVGRPKPPGTPPPNKLLPIGRSIKMPIGSSVKRPPLLNPSEVINKRPKFFSSE